MGDQYHLGLNREARGVGAVGADDLDTDQQGAARTSSCGSHPGDIPSWAGEGPSLLVAIESSDALLDNTAILGDLKRLMRWARTHGGVGLLDVSASRRGNLDVAL